ncbi:Cobalamin biosynthesis protein BluB @ 5,6-dimethylbenzimidazole synthase, flavin destructase family [hydrothermal vent metagenome]|uniref:Cobalamin biosynthesis protein BluB @ 5,6-dimethylbenzimidazole synthase, flavin destructase family n=1 Tax=hydrothermal vent metagenome TaxID=652676 RepID=A0A3B0ZIC9_9ZZZZ
MKNKQFTINDQSLLEDIMLHRRDIRGNNFLNSPIADETISKILHAASLAPSVGFSQPWEFVIVRDDEIKKQVYKNFVVENKKAEATFSDKQQEMYQQLKLEGILEAPVNIAVFYKPPTAPALGQNTIPETGEYSVVCAIQNMWLMSRAMNVGLGWVSILNPDSVKKILQAPADNKLVAYLCIGYVEEFFSTPELEKLNWKKRKQINSVVYSNEYPAVT